jgi:uncharacterized protein involved in exopolysaccharide biosynthesis
MNAPAATKSSTLRARAIRFVGGGAMLGLLIGSVAAAMTKNSWLVQAKVMLQIGPETAGSRPSMVGSPAPFLAGNPRREDVQTEVEILSSSDLLRRAFDRLLAKDRDAALGEGRGFASSLVSGTAEAIGLVPTRTDEQRALDKWASSLRIAAIPSSTMLSIESRSDRPEAAAALLQQMLDVYLEDHRKAFGGRGMADVLRDFLGKREDELAAAETRLTAMRKQIGVVDVAIEVAQLEERRGNAQEDERRIEAALASAAARKTHLLGMLERTPASLLLASEERANPTRDALDLRHAQALQDLALAKERFTDGSPEVRTAQQQAALLEELRAATAQFRQDASTTGRDPLHDALRDMLAKATAEETGLMAELAFAKKAVLGIESRLFAIEDGRAALQKLELDVEEHKRDLVQAREGLRLAQVEQTLDERQIANVAVVTPPNYLPTPQRSFGLPARVATLLACVAFFAGLGAALLFWRESAQRMDAASQQQP